MTTCLVTGGAGFIGCALSSPLADRYDDVVAIDVLHPQVHAERRRPDRLDPRVRLIVDDVARAAAWDAVLETVRPDVVVHLAAETGTAVSLTEATRHAETNVVGTTQMLDAFTRHRVRPRRIVLTSSRAVYGEGAWSGGGRLVYPPQRGHAQLARGDWDWPGMVPLPQSARTVDPHPVSVYGATKLAQEHILKSWAMAMDVSLAVLRLQNVYGPGQSLTNPYTGIVPFFAGAARRGEAIPVYEDGHIVRDFVYIDDVAAAVLAAVDADEAPERPIDIGTGVATTIATLATVVAALYGAPEPLVTAQFRDGDVRHAVADVSAARELLGWRSAIDLETGVKRLCAWIDEVIR